MESVKMGIMAVWSLMGYVGSKAIGQPGVSIVGLGDVRKRKARTMKQNLKNMSASYVTLNAIQVKGGVNERPK